MLKSVLIVAKRVCKVVHDSVWCIPFTTSVWTTLMAPQSPSYNVDVRFEFVAEAYGHLWG
jgi:hypothetical protein